MAIKVRIFFMRKKFTSQVINYNKNFQDSVDIYVNILLKFD